MRLRSESLAIASSIPRVRFRLGSPHPRCWAVAPCRNVEQIRKDTSITITEGNYTHKVIRGTGTFDVKGLVKETYKDSQETKVKNDITTEALAGTITIHAGLSKLTMHHDGTINLSGKKISIHGSESVMLSGDQVQSAANNKAKVGVGNQSLTCNKAKLETSGASISHSAVGTQELTGALIKIN